VLPQSGQVCSKRVPQLSQNLACGRFSVWQFGQAIMPGSLSSLHQLDKLDQQGLNFASEFIIILYQRVLNCELPPSALEFCVSSENLVDKPIFWYILVMIPFQTYHYKIASLSSVNLINSVLFAVGESMS
jgi:hypothetical protein